MKKTTEVPLETQLLNDWNQIVADLTPEEREMLKASTPADWLGAIAELIRDTEFWKGLCVAFLDGIVKGLGNYNAKS
jgi:hypothetical protein